MPQTGGPPERSDLSPVPDQAASVGGLPITEYSTSVFTGDKMGAGTDALITMEVRAKGGGKGRGSGGGKGEVGKGREGREGGERGGEEGKGRRGKGGKVRCWVGEGGGHGCRCLH